MHKYISVIKNNGITGDLITNIIDEHKTDRARMINLYSRYKADIGGVPILRRKPVKYDDFGSDIGIKRIDNKVNNQLNNSFDAEIVDTKVGYLLGHPIAYHIDNDDELEDALQNFVVRNNMEDADSEVGKKATICGYGARLLYIDTEGNERLRNVDPWEAIFLSDNDITEPKYAIRYYPYYDINAGDADEKWAAEFYDGADIHYFTMDAESGKYKQGKIKPHIFDYCPMFGIPNNEEMKGDAEKVLNLVDAYDRTLSDANNEIEQYRLAYLILKGVGADGETLNEMKQSGILQLLDEKEDVNYLTKDVNNQMIEDHLNRLEQNIMRFAKSVNFSDESFGSNSSGVALKFKLMALENKAIVMERKFSAALRYQFKVLCSAWSKKLSVQLDDYLDIIFQFKRNLPMNIVEEADASLKLKGIVSESTRLSMLSFIDDIDHELMHMQQERESYVDLDNIPDVPKKEGVET